MKPSLFNSIRCLRIAKPSHCGCVLLVTLCVLNTGAANAQYRNESHPQPRLSNTSRFDQSIPWREKLNQVLRTNISSKILPTTSLEVSDTPSWLFAAWQLGNGSHADWAHFTQQFAAWRAEANQALHLQQNGQSSAPIEKSRQLLSWLHTNVLKSYDANATELPRLLGKGEYNCVVATIMFQAFARELGLKTISLNSGNHCRAAVWADNRWVPIETTCPNCIQAQILASGSQNEQQLTDRELLGIIAFNRAIDFHHQRDYSDAVAWNLVAMDWYASHRGASQNLVASLNAWAITLSSSRQFATAKSILEVALTLSPDDRTTQHNYRYLADR